MALTPAAKPDPLSPGTVMIECNDGGTKSIRFYGESFVRSPLGMFRPGRRVAAFMAPVAPTGPLARVA
jgi:hypothetical protein